MGHTNTKKMVQGAMLAAIFGVLSLLNTYTGSMFDIFICYFMVIPIVWYGYHYGWKDNVIVCLVSMIVIAMVGLPFFVISAFSSCLAGVFIGEALKKDAKKDIIVFGTFLATLLNNILIYEVFAGFLGMDLVTEMKESYQMIVEFMPSIASSISQDLFISMIPIVLVLMSVFEMYIIVLLCQLILPRLKIEFKGQFHIATFHIEIKLGIILSILLFGSYILLNFVGIDQIYLRYIYILSVFAIGLDGFAFLDWLIIVLRKPLFSIMLMICLFIPKINMIYVIIGLIDIFSDLRGKIMYNVNND